MGAILGVSSTDVFSSVGSLIAAVVVVLSALGAAAAVFKANRVQTTVKVLQDLTDALKDQNENLQAQTDSQRRTIEEQDRQISDLKELVQSKAAVEALAKQVADNHQEVLSLLRAGTGGSR